MENRIKTDKSSELKSNAEMFMNLLAHGKKPIIEVRKNNKSYTRRTKKSTSKKKATIVVNEDQKFFIKQ